MAVESKVIVGLKAASCILGRTFCSVNSCLTTTGMEAGYILDFGRDRKFGRRIDPGSLKVVSIVMDKDCVYKNIGTHVFPFRL